MPKPVTKFLTNHGEESYREQRQRTDSLLERFSSRVEEIRSELKGDQAGDLDSVERRIGERRRSSP